MTARATARRLALEAAFVLAEAAAVTLLFSACYTSGAGGTDPPTDQFYFPVGLAVSSGGNVLYVANSDFDLQWNGGTIQSYDLYRLRHDTAELIGANFLPVAPMDSTNPKAPTMLIKGDGMLESADVVASQVKKDIPFLSAQGILRWAPNCQSVPQPTQINGSRVSFGDACSPPVSSQPYRQASVITGAFATDIQLSLDGTRLFSPIRGNATLTWAQVLPDNRPDSIPPGDLRTGDAGAGSAVSVDWPTQSGNPSDPFHFYCGQGPDDRCDSEHQTGAVPTLTDTRNVTLPGEPFAMAQSEDDTAVVITHQTSQQTSVLLSGLPACEEQPSTTGIACMPTPASVAVDPSMQFVLTGVPIGGDGIAAVPHDLDSPIPRCELVNYQAPCVRPAFLETTHSAAELDLLRYYNDDGSSLMRPFLVREVAYTLTVNSGGTDSRGIVIDDTPRRACKAKLGTNAAPGAITQCAELPARVFFASRAPPSLVIGEIGEFSANGDGSYDPDRLVITGNVPLQAGPSQVALGPIVDATGHYALRVFVTCFDSNEIFVYDPDAGRIENVINTGPGPFAIAFDPFSMDDVAAGKLVEADPRQVDTTLAGLGIDISSAANGPASLKRYRFAYVASFTNSYVQVIDLDDSVVEPCPDAPNESCNVTFERPVFTLGQPIPPKGS
jgi:hypothetical protein